MVGCTALKSNCSSKEAGTPVQPMIEPVGQSVCMTLNVDLANMRVSLHWIKRLQAKRLGSAGGLSVRSSKDTASQAKRDAGDSLQRTRFLQAWHGSWHSRQSSQ